MNNKIKHLIINNRNLIVFIHDLIVIALAWIAAFIIRFNFDIPEAQQISMLSNLSIALIVQVIIFLGFRIHRASWRHSSIIDIRTIALAIFCSSLVLTIYFIFFYTQQPVIPRSIIILNPLLLILFLFGSRIMYRGLREYKEYGVTSIKPKNAIVLGTSKEGVLLVKTLARNPNWHLLGLLGNDISLKGREISGVKKAIDNQYKYNKVDPKVQARKIVEQNRIDLYHDKFLKNVAKDLSEMAELRKAIDNSATLTDAEKIKRRNAIDKDRALHSAAALKSYKNAAEKKNK